MFSFFAHFVYEISKQSPQIKRNVSRFPKDFMFQLTKEEWQNLKSQIETSSWGGRRRPPFVHCYRLFF